MYGSLGLSESIPQNDISIGSAVLAQFMVMFNSHRATDTHTDHRTLAIPCVRWGLKLITSCYRIGSDSSHCGGVTPLLRASGYVWRERRFDPSIIQQVSGTCPRCVSYSCEIRAPSNTCGPKSDPNCISIGSAAFAGFTVATNGHTDHATSSVAIVCITATRAMQANNLLAALRPAKRMPVFTDNSEVNFMVFETRRRTDDGGLLTFISGPKIHGPIRSSHNCATFYAVSS